MTTLDRLYGTGNGKREKQRGTLDELFDEEEQTKVRKIRSLDAESLYLEKLKTFERTKQELEQLRGRSNTTGGWGSSSTGDSSPQTNTGIELVKILIKQGMDMQKATETIANMDPDTMMKLAMVSGTQGGMQSLMPLLLFAKNPTVAPMDIVLAAKDLVKTMQPAQSVSPAKDLAEAIALLRPKDESGEAVAYLNEKLERLEGGLAAEREARHQIELKHSEELRQIDKANTDRQLADISRKLDEANTKKSAVDGDPFAYVRKAKEDLVGLGIVGEPKESSPVDVADKIANTVMNSPGMTSFLGAAGQRIRERGTGGPRGGQTQAPAPGQTFYCDVCNSGVAEKGIAPGTRTVLPLTAAVAAGRETVTCPRCGTSFGKQDATGQPPGPGPQPPARGPGTF